MKTVFIYALRCPLTGVARYVGKAKNPKRRLKLHLWQSEHSNSHRACWIKSLTKAGLAPVLEILDEVPESEWPQWEVAWIALFREQGFDLVNANDGGEGGHNPSAATRAKLRAISLGKKYSAATRAKHSVNSTGRPQSEETRARQSASKSGSKHPNFGKHLSEETRKKIGISKIGNRCRHNWCVLQLKNLESCVN